jgi:hypothetical protein
VFRFIAALLGATTALLVALFLMQRSQLITRLPSFGWQTTIFLAASTGVVYWYVLKFHKQGFTIQAVMGSVLLKLVGSLAFLLLVVYKDPAGALPNALVFMIGYLLFTALEIAFLYPRISR